jgi:hypothetical protein
VSDQHQNKYKHMMAWRRAGRGDAERAVEAGLRLGPRAGGARSLDSAPLYTEISYRVNVIFFLTPLIRLGAVIYGDFV